ncbi:MAG TPA: beta-L-arabinofuranosidase domain-containing protein [Pseudonocardiaceae bacterium]|nr:beta-L-arabinofuranosidase domain-containing protein [Pseudonocardiaceae bacterium]
MTGPLRPGPSAHVAFRPADGATITGGIWHARRKTNAEVSVPDGHERLDKAGNFHDLRLAAGQDTGEYANDLPFMDSDLYKWLEAVGWLRGSDVVSGAPAARLDEWVDGAVSLLAAAQEPSGYLQSYFQVVRPGVHFEDLEWGHELYCAGHLIQAAVAHARGTGRTDLLAVATRVADHVADTFGPGRGQGVCGHPEIETALVELYRTTGERRYLSLARYFVDQRGHGLLRDGRFGARYWQDHVPVRDATEVAGHAVRQLYLLAGVVDVHAETGETALLAAAERLWTDMVESRTYLTGGLGAHHKDEAFGDRFELPSERAYAETCAAIASVQLSWRLLLATGRARYADLMERTLYNGFLSGVALSGDHYLYVNPLQVREGHAGDGSDHGPARTPWFHCACCPPNVMRLLASLHHYVTARDNTGIVLHQFVPGEYRATTPAGPVVVRVATEYPWQGDIDVHIGQSGPLPWTVTLRVPDWCGTYRVSVNGSPVPDRAIDGWLRVERTWAPGDVLRLELAMPPRLTTADPRVDAVRGCVAIERGPLVYCVEHADHGEVSLDDVVLDPAAPLDVIERPELLGGVVTVAATGRLRRGCGGSWWPYRHDDAAVGGPVRLTAIPYQVWGHREPGAMRVWLPTG